MMHDVKLKIKSYGTGLISLITRPVTISISLALIAGVLLSSCDDSTNRKSSNHINTEHLIIGTSADNPPFEFFATTQDHQNIDESIQGFDIDLAKALGQQMAMTVKFKDMDFNGLIPALQAGRIDMIMAGLTPTPQRLTNLEFSDSYYSANCALLVKDGFNGPIVTPQQLHDKRIGAQLGSTLELTLKSLSTDVSHLTIVSLNRLGDLVQELHAGRIDGLLTEQAIAEAYVKQHPDLGVVQLQGAQGDFSVALPKGSALLAKVNIALTTLRSTGQLEKIRQKWFPTS